MAYLRLSTEGDEDRLEADDTEKRDAAIQRFRQVVKGASGDV
jgi:hypothetical protein